MKLDIECMTSSGLRNSAGGSLVFLVPRPDARYHLRQSNDLPTQLQRLKTEYINAVGAATANALTLLLEDVIGSCRLPA